MLDPGAYGKGLLDHVHPGVIKHPLGIRRAVPDGEDQAVRGEFPLSLRAAADYRLQRVMPQPDFGQLHGKENIPAQRSDLLPDGSDDLGKPIRADMGPGQIKDFLRRAVGMQFIQYELASRVLDARGQLPVGKGPRAALAKLNVAFGVQLPRLREHGCGFLSFLHPLAPLQNDGAQPGPGQRQGGEHAPRAEPGDHGPKPPVLSPHRRRRVGRLYGGGDAGLQGFEQLFFPFQGHVHRHHEMHVSLVPGVHAFFADPPGDHPALVRLDLLQRDLKRRVCVRVQGHFQIANSDHAAPPPFRNREYYSTGI